MNLRVLLAAMLALITAVGVHAETARAETGICQHLKEISSLDPDKNILLDYKTREQRCRRHYWQEFRPLPLSHILSKAESLKYDRAIARRNCAVADVLLRKGFVKAHPAAPTILDNDANYKHWKTSTVRDYFPMMALCFNLETIRKAQEKIDRLGLEAAPYAGHKKSLASKAAKHLPWPVQERHYALFRIHRSLGRFKKPTIALALLKLSVEGKALKYHDSYELYIALRLRGHDRSDRVIQQIIDRPLGAGMKSRIEQAARLGSYKNLPFYPN